MSEKHFDDQSGQIHVELYGKPSSKVVETIKKAVGMTMSEMGFEGTPPQYGLLRVL